MSARRPLLIALCLLLALPTAAVAKPGHGTRGQEDHAGTPLTVHEPAAPARAPESGPPAGGGGSETGAWAIPAAAGGAVASILLLALIRRGHRTNGPVRAP